MARDGKKGRFVEVDNARSLLVNAARVDPVLRDAAVLVDGEIHRLRGEIQRLRQALRQTVMAGNDEGGSGWFVAKYAREALDANGSTHAAEVDQ